MDKENITVQVRIAKELHEAAKKSAEKLGLNFSAYVRYLISKEENK